MASESPIKRMWLNYWKWRNQQTRRFSSASKIFYPNRPVFTLLIGLGIISLAFLGILPLWLALFLGVNIMIDDIILTPVMQIASDIRNLKHRRKQTKSIVHLVVILVGFLVGVLLGYFLFMTMPALAAFMPLIRTGIDTSLTLLAIAGTGSIVLAKIMKISPLILMLFVGLVILALPIPAVFPVAVDIIIASFLLGGFFASLASKYVMKVIYKILYGDSNADGLNFAHKKEHMSVDDERADVFSVKTEVAKKFRLALVGMINTIKRVSPYYTKITGSHNHQIGAYKDMFHAFMRARKDDAISLADVKSLIHLDEETDDSLTHYFSKPKMIMQEVYGEKRQVAGFFARLGAASNSYSNTEKGFEFKNKMHHFHAGYIKATIFNKDKESMKVYEEYQEAAKEFYHSAF